MRGQEYTSLCLLAQTCLCVDAFVMLLLSFLLLLLTLLADILAVIRATYLITASE